MKTKAGMALALALAKSIGTGDRITEVCSLICRHARTYARIQESACNDDLSERETARRDKREAQIEERIKILCQRLPRVKGEAIAPVFSGDPRGATVKLRLPDGRSNDWGGEGICVPNS